MHNVNSPDPGAVRFGIVVIVAACVSFPAHRNAESAQTDTRATERRENEQSPSHAPVQFRTGKRFADALDRTIAISWQERRLRSGLRQLSESREVAVLLDRRIDPEQMLTLGLAQVSLREALTTIAAECDAGVTIVGNTVYVGPAPLAARLRTIVEIRSRELVGEGAAIDAQRGLELLRRSSLVWQDLARPSDIVADVCRRAGLQADASAGKPAGTDLRTGLPAAVPYDLWAAAGIPQATVTEKLTLLLAQYDLGFEWLPGAHAIRLVPVLKNPAVQRSWPLLSRVSRTRAEEVQRRFRGMPQQLKDSKLTLTGTVEQLEDVDRLMHPERFRSRTGPQPSGPGELSFTLEIRGRLGSLLKGLAQKSDIRFEYDPSALTAAGVRLDRRVEIRMQNASLSQLCAALFKDSRIVWKISGRTVTLTPGPQF